MIAVCSLIVAGALYFAGLSLASELPTASDTAAQNTVSQTTPITDFVDGESHQIHSVDGVLLNPFTGRHFADGVDMNTLVYTFESYGGDIAIDQLQGSDVPSDSPLDGDKDILSLNSDTVAQEDTTSFSKGLIFVEAQLTAKGATNTCKFLGGKLVQLKRFLDTTLLLATNSEVAAFVGPNERNGHFVHVMELQSNTRNFRDNELFSYTLRTPKTGDKFSAVCEISENNYEIALAKYKALTDIMSTFSSSSTVTVMPTDTIVGHAIKVYEKTFAIPEMIFSTDRSAAQLIAKLSMFHTDKSLELIAALQAMRSRLAARMSQMGSFTTVFELWKQKQEKLLHVAATRLFRKENDSILADGVNDTVVTQAMVHLNNALVVEPPFDVKSLAPEMREQYERELAMLQHACRQRISARVELDYSTLLDNSSSSNQLQG